MKRRVSICIIICTAVLSAAVLINSQKKELPKAQMAKALPEASDMEPVVVVNTDNPTVFLYVIKDSGGRAIVYHAQSMELYMETGIRTAELPEEVRDRLISGIGFSDEESLFDFLESYSS